MELLRVEDDVKRCPFMDISCEPLCPAWLAGVAEVGDCLFHACLTKVKEVFVEAAVYFDRHFDLPVGTGHDMMVRLRNVLTGNATDDDKEVVRSTIGGMLSSGVLQKVSDMSIGQIGSVLSGAEKFIRFDLGNLFDFSQEEEAEGGEGEEPPF